MNQSHSQKQTKAHTKSFDTLLINSLRDPDYAKVYLQVALDEYQTDNNTEAFMMALRDVAEAQGGLGQLAQNIKLKRQSLYHILSKKGNPSLRSLSAILKNLGFQLSIASA